jgi:hypothetical protein
MGGCAGLDKWRKRTSVEWAVARSVPNTDWAPERTPQARFAPASVFARTYPDRGARGRRIAPYQGHSPSERTNRMNRSNPRPLLSGALPHTPQSDSYLLCRGDDRCKFYLGQPRCVLAHKHDKFIAMCAIVCNVLHTPVELAYFQARSKKAVMLQLLKLPHSRTDPEESRGGIAGTDFFKHTVAWVGLSEANRGRRYSSV